MTRRIIIAMAIIAAGMAFQALLLEEQRRAEAARTACEIQPECKAGKDGLWPNNGVNE